MTDPTNKTPAQLAASLLGSIGGSNGSKQSKRLAAQASWTPAARAKRLRNGRKSQFQKSQPKFAKQVRSYVENKLRVMGLVDGAGQKKQS